MRGAPSARPEATEDEGAWGLRVWAGPATEAIVGAMLRHEAEEPVQEQCVWVLLEVPPCASISVACACLCADAPVRVRAWGAGSARVRARLRARRACVLGSFR